MPTMIANEERCIRITIADNTNENVIVINKQQIKVIDNPNREIVRINIGEGPLKHIILRASDVSNPHTFNESKELRDYLVQIWMKDYTDTATETKQDEEIAKLESMIDLLQSIKTTFSKNNILVGGLSQPLITDNAQVNNIYFGYSVPTTPVSSAAWAIKKTVTSNGNTVELWAYGSQTFTNIWNNRYSLTYATLATN